MIQVSLAFDRAEFELSCALRNLGSELLMVEGITHANYRIRQARPEGESAEPWFGCVMFCSGQLHVLQSRAEASFTLRMLDEYVFPEHGPYVARAVYNPHRPGVHPGVRDYVEPLRALSNEVGFELTEADLQLNRMLVNERLATFFGPKSSANV